MILVLGSVALRADAVDEGLRLGAEHVRRSRGEPGCIAHDVYRDPDDPLRLVFVEKWASREALAGHFAVPASGAFVAAIGRIASGRPRIEIYDASPIEVGGLGGGRAPAPETR